MEPVVLFKGKDNIGVDERQQYSKGVHVIFTPNAVINGPSMDLYTAWIRTQKGVDFERAFLDIGYTWMDDSPISIRTLPGFIFDPSTVTSSTINVDDNDEDEEEYNGEKMMIEKNKNSQMLGINNNRVKQLSLDQFMKK